MKKSVKETVENTGKANGCRIPRNCFTSLSKSEAYSLSSLCAAGSGLLYAYLGVGGGEGAKNNGVAISVALYQKNSFYATNNTLSLVENCLENLGEDCIYNTLLYTTAAIYLTHLLSV